MLKTHEYDFSDVFSREVWLDFREVWLYLWHEGALYQFNTAFVSNGNAESVCRKIHHLITGIEKPRLLGTRFYFWYSRGGNTQLGKSWVYN